MERIKNLKNSSKLIIMTLITVLLMASANLAMTSMRSVEVFTTKLTTASGHEISAQVYKPKSATADNKAPAIAFMHGLSTTKEAYIQYGIELSRRGYVVISADMLNHGDSELSGMEVFFGSPDAEGYGLYTTVRYLGGLDYVDTSQIGVAGHSMGGNAVNSSIFIDNFSPKPLISAAYLLSSDPMLTDFSGQPANIYGDRSVGIFYSTKDHVYFKGKNEVGEPLSEKQYLSSVQAKTFASFGLGMKDTVISDHEYKNPQGSAIRVIHQEDVIHPYAQGGDKAITAMLDFFNDRFEAPNPIKATSIVANVYQVLSLLTLFSTLAVGYFILRNLLEIPFFNSLKAKEPKEMRIITDKKEKIWSITFMLVNVLFAFLSVTLIFKNGFGYFVLPYLPQQVSNIFALWSLINGLFILFTILVSYLAFGKKKGYTLRAWGITLKISDFLKSILIGVLTFIGIIAFSYLAGYVFKIDMRMYLWGIRHIPFNKLYLFGIYAPFFIVFAVAVSLSINGVNFTRFESQRPWVNTLVHAVLNMFPPLFITILGYYLFSKTGIQPNIFGSTYTYTYMINAIPAYPVAIIYLRALNKHTNSPYVSGVIVGLLFAFFQVASVFTMHTVMFM